ncbi:MAG: apolipoprotein N-acyltransferase [Mycobacteriales bacterium]
MPAPVVRTRSAFALALLAGLGLMAAFPPHDLRWLAPIAVGALSVAVHGRSLRVGCALGFVFAAAFFIPLLHFCAIYVGAAPWLILAVFESLYLAVMAGLMTLAQRLPGWPVWTAALWVGQEAVRGRLPFGGFPWGRLVFRQPDGPFLPFVAVGGAPLLTFVIALAGSLLALAVVGCKARWYAVRRRALAGALGCAVVVPLLGLALGPLMIHSGSGDPHRTVAVVQGNVPRLGLDFNAQREAVLRYHVRQTERLAAAIKAGTAPRPAFVVWPENSSDIDPTINPDAAALIHRAAQAIDVPILVGTLLDGPGEKVRNAGIVWDPKTGPGQTYIKRHPVPFAEYMPMRSIARLVTSKVDLVGNMIAGTRVGALQIAGTTVGDVICFEIAEDGLVRDAVDHGATVLLVQTNNATFGRSGEAPQQFAMARIRAVEHSRTAMVASTTGISGVIAPDGTVLARSSIYTAAAFSRSVPLSTGTTLADRLGDGPEWALTGLGFLTAAAALGLGRRMASAHRSRPDLGDKPDNPEADLTTAGRAR